MKICITNMNEWFPVYEIGEEVEYCDKEEHEIECIKEYLYNIKNLPTVSGILSIDSYGDADKVFELKKLVNGELIYIK